MSSFLPNEWVVEPCNVAIINCITSVNVGNIAGYSCSDKPGNKSEDIITNAEKLVGNIKLEAGFNCAISERNNTFTVESVEGGGACLSESYCTGNLLEVDNECVLCNETVKAINGVNGKSINIQGGPGVTVTCKDEHTLLITLNTQQFKNGCEQTIDDQDSSDQQGG